MTALVSHYLKCDAVLFYPFTLFMEAIMAGIAGVGSSMANFADGIATNEMITKMKLFAAGHKGGNEAAVSAV